MVEYFVMLRRVGPSLGLREMFDPRTADLGMGRRYVESQGRARGGQCREARGDNVSDYIRSPPTFIYQHRKAEFSSFKI